MHHISLFKVKPSKNLKLVHSVVLNCNVAERKNLFCVNGPYVQNTDVVRNRAWLHNTKKEKQCALNHEKNTEKH